MTPDKFTGATTRFRYVDADQADDAAPPPGTAITRPLRHVRAVRERHAQRFANPAEAAASCAARAWAWALGESTIAPVTGQPTPVPPSRTAIQAETTIADDRRLRGDQENRADAAATILRWLIGQTDRVPIRCGNPGELAGGFGDIVRSRAPPSWRSQSTVKSEPPSAAGMSMRILPTGGSPQQDADYLDGVAATLAWILGEQPEAPITRSRSRERTTPALKAERVYAEDIISQSRNPGMTGQLPPPSYGEAVRQTITWLLGDSTTPPVEQAD